jgi:hypothetical protein
MAVVVEVVVARGSKAEFDGVDVAVSSAMERSGPAAGLMSHLVKPVGDGFVISDVWRAAQDFDPFWDEVAPRRRPGGLAGLVVRPPVAGQRCAAEVSARAG